MRKLTTSSTIAGVVLAAATVAVAAWLIAGSGSGTSKAATVGAGNAPTPSVTGRTVSLSWSASTLSTGDAVTGYTIKRYDSGGTVEQTIASGSCASTVAGTSCSETAVPSGTWKYSVTPRLNNWAGPESTKVSAAVGSPTVSLSTSTVSSPGTLSGTISNFIAGQTITFRLDSTSGTVLSGTVDGTATPTAMPSGSSAAITATLPAGVSGGSHSLYAIASGGESASAGFQVDITPPPVPTIDSGPGSLTTATSASFTFSDTEGGVTFSCQIDGGGYSGCSSPKSYSSLSEGTHSFGVKAIDAATNQSAAATYNWTVDVATPTVAITFPVNGSTYGATTFTAGCGTSSTGDVCGTSSDSWGVSTVEVSILQQSTGRYWNGTQFPSGSAERLLTATGTTSWSYAISSSSFSDGAYTLRALATDNAGRTSSVTSVFTIDTVAPPTPTITSDPANPTNATSATFGFSDSESGTTFECQIDGGGYSSCTSTKSYSGLTQGSHTFSVRALDASGNASTAASYTWTLDTTSPTGVITFPVSGSSYNTTTYNAGCGTSSTGDMCGTSADTGGAGVQNVKVSIRRGTGNYWNGSSFGSASEVLLNATGTTSWTLAFAAANIPADGSYTVRTVVTDNASNTGSVSSTFTWDTVAPTASAIDTVNNGGGGTSIGKAQQGDTITFTYSEQVAPSSVLSGWSGASTNVVVRITNGSGANNDVLTVWDSANTSQLPLGSVDLGRTDYVTASVTFGASGTASSMSQSGADITVTLGTVSASGSVTQAGAFGSMVWTPSATATDLAGNAASTTPLTEGGSNDKEF